LAESVLKSENMKRRRVLVIDNVPSCPKETEVRNVSYFSQLNVASLCRPMDHGVHAVLKIKYQYSLLQSHTEGIEEGRGMLENLKKPTRCVLDNPGIGEY
jgi:hypothetical protein